MKYFLKIFMIAVAMVTAIPSFAVSEKDMEHARAIAAKHYLRYANNGSDYLDKLNPSSVAELSKSLKAKEQENIKSFNAVALPKDYASWDKKKLVEYWSSTFFKSPGLKDDGKKCLSVLAKNLNKLNVSAPTADSKPADPKPAEPNAQDQKAANESKPAAPSPAPATAAETGSQASNESAEQTVLKEAEAQAAVEEAVAQAEADAGLADEQPKKSSNTGWYIGILVVLVGVVIWLVVYASKSMKETGASLSDHKAGEKEIREAKKAAKEEQNKMREQYANSLTSKNEEIKQLKAKTEALEREVDAAKRESDGLRRELSAAKRELAALMQSNAEAPKHMEAEQRRQSDTVTHPEPARVAQAPQRPVKEQQSTPASVRAQSSPARPGGLPPVVFLGYVNQKGLFVKASRTLNVESSVYRMDIPDGHHGLFRVVNDPDILDRLLDNVAQWLEGGCVIENPEDADIAAEIITLQPGEATFSDNTCRVTKKARIKFV
ncbi:MAG: hypothetical protein K2L45_09380 [Muribaculaceae bacterium]|nr:hypothetical protein [Muribaculaceae bacterium]